ncbi:hypothetical protein GLOIN_2v1792131 [Rhizophagus clarus]|uniref:Uncharacterized protein n=1 Tax=Rhizophagus clarus TaxID=94130 RepID=A0A8H3LD26_9GLOM|nr:hypothetical protein GLOIN_2v1792131 [Rhizophagus clarus]
MPLALSVCNLHEIIMKKLYTIHGNPLSFTIYIPSEEWIYLQFCSTNIITIRSIYHTGQFNIKFKIQGQLLQKNSDNAYYYIALFCYIFISILEDIFGSFYDSQVFVSYKNTTFEPNPAIRHSTEFLNALNIQYEYQIVLIALLLQEDFDILIAVCTMPNHSWINLIECIISILNLSLQGVAIKRNQMSPESVTLFEMTIDKYFR